MSNKIKENILNFQLTNLSLDNLQNLGLFQKFVLYIDLILENHNFKIKDSFKDILKNQIKNNSKNISIEYILIDNSENINNTNNIQGFLYVNINDNLIGSFAGKIILNCNFKSSNGSKQNYTIPINSDNKELKNMKLNNLDEGIKHLEIFINENLIDKINKFQNLYKTSNKSVINNNIINDQKKINNNIERKFEVIDYNMDNKKKDDNTNFNNINTNINNNLLNFNQNSEEFTKNKLNDSSVFSIPDDTKIPNYKYSYDEYDPNNPYNEIYNPNLQFNPNKLINPNEGNLFIGGNNPFFTSGGGYCPGGELIGPNSDIFSGVNNMQQSQRFKIRYDPIGPFGTFGEPEKKGKKKNQFPGKKDSPGTDPFSGDFEG